MNIRFTSLFTAVALSLIFSTTPAHAQAPTQLVATKATRSEVDLGWSGTAASYSVQRRPLGGAFATIATVSQTSAVDMQIDAFTTYQYQILAAGTATPSSTITVGPPPVGFSLAAPAPSVAGSPVTSYGYDISMALDSNGDPAFSFVFDDPNQDSDHSDTQLLFRSWNRAAYSWNSAAVVATVGDVATPFRNVDSLAYDGGTGTWAIASEYQTFSDSGVKLWISTDGGKTWTLKQTYAVNTLAYGPSIALGGGNIHLAFSIDTIGVRYYTGVLSAPAATWAVNTTFPALNGMAQFDTGPSLALDSAGQPGVAFWVEDPNSSDNEILYFWRPANSSTPIRVTDSQNNPTDVAEALAFSGTNPRILFYAQRMDAPSGLGDHVVVSNDGGATWATPVVLPPDGTSSTDYPFSLAIDSKGGGAVAFGQNSGTGDAKCGNPKLSRSSDLMNWTTCAAADISLTGGFQVYPDSIALAYGGNGKLFMLWKDNASSGAGVFLWHEAPDQIVNTPTITEGGVVSNATGLAGIVSGSWVSIYGANFADLPMDWSSADFSNGLPKSLEGVQVLMNNLPAAVYYVAPTQIDVQAPAGLSGNVSVQVIRNGVPGNTVNAVAVAHAPGLFAYSIDYKTYYPSAVFLNSVVVGDPAVAGNSVSKAHPGDYILLFATGLGTSPAGSIVQSPIPFPDPVTVKIGTEDAQVLGSAYLIYAGEYQINIQVPMDIQPGNYPIVLSTDGASTQPNVILPVEAKP